MLVPHFLFNNENSKILNNKRQHDNKNHNNYNDLGNNNNNYNLNTIYI